MREKRTFTVMKDFRVKTRYVKFCEDMRYVKIPKYGGQIFKILDMSFDLKTRLSIYITSSQVFQTLG